MKTKFDFILRIQQDWPIIQKKILWAFELISFIGTFFILSSVTFLISLFILPTFELSTTTDQVFFYMTVFSVTLTFIVSFAFLKRFRIWINIHSSSITFLSIFLAVIIFCFQSGIQVMQSTYEAEDAIKQANNLNFQVMNDVTGNDTSNTLPIYWAQMSVDAYEKNYQYISKNYNRDCLNAYANAIYYIHVFNMISSHRMELDIPMAELSPSSTEHKRLVSLSSYYYQLQLSLASTTKNNLSYAVGNCQDYKQRNK